MSKTAKNSVWESMTSEAATYVRNLGGIQKEYMDSYFKGASQHFLEKLQLVCIPAGKTFAYADTTVENIFILLNGKVTAVDYRVKEIVYGFYHFTPVQVLGGMEILGCLNRYKASLSAAEDSCFLKISKKSFEEWIRSDINALRMESEKIIKYLTDQSMSERLYMLIPASKRLCLILRNFYEAYGKEKTWSIYLSRRELIEMTGLSERSVTRAIKDLQERGCIAKIGRKIVVTSEQYQKMKGFVDDSLEEMEEFI